MAGLKLAMTSALERLRWGYDVVMRLRMIRTHAARASAWKCAVAWPQLVALARLSACLLASRLFVSCLASLGLFFLLLAWRTQLVLLFPSLYDDLYGEGLGENKKRYHDFSFEKKTAFIIVLKCRF